MELHPSDIDAYLSAAEYEHQIAIIGAWDTGSHAWGLASESSDYDIKILYARPLSQYPTTPSDHTIDTDGTALSAVDDRTALNPELVEIAGWDVSYFTELLADSNPSALEAIHSPVAYRTHPLFTDMRGYTKPRFNIIDLANHYRGLANKNYRKYLSGERQDKQTVKRTVNVVRALMYAEYAYETHKFPPLVFTEFIESAPDAIADSWAMDEVETLVDKKTSGQGTEHIGNQFEETIESKLDALSMDAIEQQDHLRDEYMSAGELRRMMQELVQSRLLTQ